MGVAIYESEIKDGATIDFEGKKIILINKDAKGIERYWILEHELSHIILDNLYDANTDAETIKEIEKETNIFALLKNEKMSVVGILMNKGYSKEKIKETLHLTDHLLNVAIDYVTLKKIERGKKMRNTLNLYCLKEQITIEELAQKLGISINEVIEMLNEDAVIKEEYLKTLCELFSCEPKDLIL